MKTVSVGYATYRTTATSTRNWRFIKFVRADGEVYGFTNGDRRKEIDGVWYVPGFRPFAVQTTADARPGNTEAEGGFSDDAVTDEDIRAGKWDKAYWEYFEAKWDNLTLGTEPMQSGFLGEVTNGRTQFVAELQSLASLLTQTIGRLIQAPCDADLGDSRCKVRLDPPAWAALTAYTVRPVAEAALGSVVKHASRPARQFRCTTAGTSGAAAPTFNNTIGGTTSDGSVTWTTEQALTVTGTITSVDDVRLEFRDNTRAEAADFFGAGQITFTSGDNDGVSQDVKSYAADGTITVQLPFPFDVEAGDTYEMTAGCRKDFLLHCKAKFDNGNNFPMFPHVTGNDYILSGKVAEAA